VVAERGDRSQLKELDLREALLDTEVRDHLDTGQELADRLGATRRGRVHCDNRRHLCAARAFAHLQAELLFEVAGVGGDGDDHLEDVVVEGTEELGPEEALEAKRSLGWLTRIRFCRRGWSLSGWRWGTIS
jgi:hypothetical protein